MKAFRNEGALRSRRPAASSWEIFLWLAMRGLGFGLTDVFVLVSSSQRSFLCGKESSGIELF